MKLTKKCISIVLSVILIMSSISCICFSVSADELNRGKCGENISYVFFEDSGLLKISGSGYMYDFSSQAGYSYSPFYNNNKIVSVVIEDGPVNIGQDMFFGCENLTDIYIPDSIYFFEQGCFWGCANLKEITIPQSVIGIGSYMFWYSGLKSLYYMSSEQDWKDISIGEDNDEITSAFMHYNSNKSFTKGLHTNDFVHTRSDSWDNAGFKKVKTYSMSSSYKNRLMNGMTAGEKKRFVNKYVNSKWDGSCYGIAATMGLAYLDKLPVVNNSAGRSYYSMGRPCLTKNKEFLDNINFYFLSQYVDRFNKYKRHYYKPSKFLLFDISSLKSDYDSLPEFFNDAISILDEDGIVQFGFGEPGGGGHSILMTGYYKNYDGSFTFTLYDENSVSGFNDLGEKSELHLSADKKKFSFGNINEKNFTRLNLYDFDDYNRAENSKFRSVEDVSVENTYNISVSESDEFKIVDSKGKVLTFEDGAFDGDINVLDINTIDKSTIDGSEQISSYTFTLEGDPNITFTPTDGSGEIDIYDNNEFMSLSAQNLTSAKIDLDSEMVINGDNCQYNVAIGDKGSDEGIYNLNAIQSSQTKIGYNIDQNVVIDSQSTLTDIKLEYCDLNQIKPLIDNVSVDNVVVTDDQVKSDGKVLYCDHNYVSKITCKATTTSVGKSVIKCTLCGTVKSTQTIARIRSVKLSGTSYTYNGKTKTPSVVVKNVNGKTLVKNTDYTVSYASGRKYVGKYAVKVTFKGKYSGTKTLYFTIKPKATSIKSVSAGSKKFTVKWYKRTTQTTGYQVQYSTSSKFSSPKTVTIGKTGTTYKTVKKLRAKKRYYVRVRTYKTVKINGKATKIYSSWSKAKYVTTKS